MSHQDSMVRERTDALDKLGNTTAATGKGFAVGSAALTALALLASYTEVVRTGFDRWVEQSPVVSDIEDDNAHTVPVLKITNGLIAARDSNDQQKNHGYLIYLGKRRSGGVELQKIFDASKGDVLMLDLAALEKNDRLVSVQKATIPDFVRYYDVTIMNPTVLVGMFMGVLITFMFCSLTMKAVGHAARSIVDEVRRQFRESPGIMQGTVEPDYASCVRISTVAAQKAMVGPALLGLVVPLCVGLVLGVAGVMGMLASALTAGFGIAVMMSNAGAAWDNAKKYIEGGAHGGKGSASHKASVVGDTVGDPFKDTSGPSLNILIKLISMVSVVCAGLVVRYSLQAFELF